MEGKNKVKKSQLYKRLKKRLLKQLSIIDNSDI